MKFSCRIDVQLICPSCKRVDGIYACGCSCDPPEKGMDLVCGNCGWAYDAYTTKELLKLFGKIQIVHEFESVEDDDLEIKVQAVGKCEKCGQDHKGEPSIVCDWHGDPMRKKEAEVVPFQYVRCIQCQLAAYPLTKNQEGSK
jgi:hypothetical protein